MKKKFMIWPLLAVLFLVLINALTTGSFSNAAIIEGDGSSTNPYLIKTIDDLYKIPKDPAAHYKIVNDLDNKNVIRKPMDEFRGVLDGNGHTIHNLNIYGETGYIGLFFKTSEATIKNIIISNLFIDQYTTHIGAIAAESYKTSFTNCIVKNSRVTSSGGFKCGIIGYSISSTYKNCYSINNIIKGTVNVGGLVGFSQDDESFIKCYSTSEISGTQQCIGGLVGSMLNGGTLKECFTSNIIIGWNYTGGLIGFSYRNNNAPVTAIENSYSTCKLIGTDSNSNLNGLIGFVYNKNTAEFQPTVKNSYFSGELFGANKYGLSTTQAITDSYFDKTKTQISTPINNARTTEEMNQKSNYANWDFKTIWEIEDDKGCPTLRFMNNKTENPEEPIVTTSPMVIIEKTEQLQLSITENINDNEELIWTSSDETVASVDKTGFVTGHTLGESLITVQCNNTDYKENIYVMVVSNTSS